MVFLGAVSVSVSFAGAAQNTACGFFDRLVHHFPIHGDGAAASILDGNHHPARPGDLRL